MNKASILAASLLLSRWAVAGAAESNSAPNHTGKPSYTAAPMPITTPNRSVFMNGIDISSSRNQDLRNVHVKISENGDIFIAGPQYQVTEEETFMPLSSYTGKSQPPAHRPPQDMSSSAPKTAKSIPETTNSEKPASTPSPATPQTPILNQPAQPASANPPKTGG